MSYFQAEVYHYLRDNPGARALTITKALGMKYEPGVECPTRQCVGVLQKLRRSGLARRNGDGWEVVPGTRAPKDGRGNAPGSRLAIKDAGKSNIHNLCAKTGRHIRPVATTALEQAWGWLPSPSRELQAENESAKLIGGTVRPENTEAA